MDVQVDQRIVEVLYAGAALRKGLRRSGLCEDVAHAQIILERDDADILKNQHLHIDPIEFVWNRAPELDDMAVHAKAHIAITRFVERLAQHGEANFVAVAVRCDFLRRCGRSAYISGGCRRCRRI